MTSTEQVWEMFSERLKAFIFSKVHDKDITEDILQDLFIRMHSKIDTLRNQDKLTTWIYQIARNLITDHFRKLGRTAQLIEKDTEDSSNESDSAIMETAVNDMIGMMDSLPAHYCEALCMTEIQGMSQADYAAKAGIPYSSAKSRVQRSRRLLRDMLMKCCHYQFDKYGTVLSITSNKCCCCKPHH